MIWHSHCSNAIESCDGDGLLKVCNGDGLLKVCDGDGLLKVCKYVGAMVVQNIVSLVGLMSLQPTRSAYLNCSTSVYS